MRSRSRFWSTLFFGQHLDSPSNSLPLGRAQGPSNPSFGTFDSADGSDVSRSLVNMVETAPAAEPSDTDPSSHQGRWIVGVDGSESSQHAALWAAAHADGRATELQLLAAWSIPVTTAMGSMSALTIEASFDALGESAHATVNALARDLDPLTTVSVTRNVGQGGASSLLIEAAIDSSLLVVGSRGRGGFARLVLGSASTQCATHSSAPVAVIPSTASTSPVRSIVVAFDGSTNSTAALLWAVGFAAPGSTIDCVSIWDPTPMAVGAGQFVLPEGSGLARERFEHLFAQSMEGTSRPDIEVRHQFVESRARPELAARAAAADMLVMGARGHGAIGAAVLGSVSTWLLHHVQRPMVVVPQSTVTEPVATSADVNSTPVDQEE
jgi:nucleotide-binding universal stress UspA family protein